VNKIKTFNQNTKVVRKCTKDLYTWGVFLMSMSKHKTKYIDGDGLCILINYNNEDKGG